MLTWLERFLRQMRARSIRLGARFGRARADEEFARELESHLQLHIDDFVRSGLSPQEGRRRAVMALGGVEQTEEIHRDQRGIPVIETFLRDLRYGARGLRKSPAFAVAAVVILGLGIGVNTAIFTLVNAVILRPLPFPDSDRVMRLWHTPPPLFGEETFALSPANFIDWQEQSQSFEHMAIYRSNRQTLTGERKAESVITGRASAALFPTLGLKPILGRLFSSEEDGADGEKTAVLTETMWRTRFGSDPKIVGRVLELDGEGVRVIGVVSQPGAVVNRTEMWMPLAWDAAKRAVRANHNFRAIAKLKRGVSVAQAQADLDTISSRLAQQYPADNKGWGALVRPLQDDLVGDVRASLLLLLGAVALVLLIACANLANLLLVRTHGRAKEIAVRTALGASRSRVMLQLLSEGVLLGVGGGAAGLLGSFCGVDLLVGAFGSALPRAAEVSPDGRVLAFTAMAAMFAGLMAAAAPAWRLTKRDATEVLKSGTGRGNTRAGDGRVRNLLVISEVALALMLLVGAGLLMKSLAGLRAVDPGFDSRNLLTFNVDVPTARYPTSATINGFFTTLLDQTRGLPGVESAAAVDTLPLQGGSEQPVATEKTTGVQQSELPIVAVRMTSPAFFQTIRIPLLTGRDFTEADAGGQALVAVVGERAAARLWPNENPIGKRLTLGLLSNEPREVVGVVRDIKIGQLDEAESAPVVYLPVAQLGLPPSSRSADLTLVVRTSVPPASLTRLIVAKVREIDPEVPVQDIMTMDAVVEQSLGQRPFAMLLLAAFAILALTLATVGIYSVIAYSVGQRVREIGIRLALGAPSSSVLKMILVEGLKPTLTGMSVGLGLALVLVRLLASQLFAVSAYDPATFGLVAALVVAVGVLATLIPAYRATRVDPIVTLRAE